MAAASSHSSLYMYAYTLWPLSGGSAQLTLMSVASTFTLVSVSGIRTDHDAVSITAVLLSVRADNPKVTLPPKREAISLVIVSTSNWSGPAPFDDLCKVVAPFVLWPRRACLVAHNRLLVTSRGLVASYQAP